MFDEAQQHLVGGVDSPVRAFRAVGGTPRFIIQGSGPFVWDVDGNRYVDYLASWGPLIAGHAHRDVVSAVQAAAARGTSFGAPTESEVRLAEQVKAAFPSMALLRFTSSGTEATMSALRVARAFTGRDLTIKLDGGYHGHSDALLVQAGSGPTTLGVPDSAGVPAALARETLSVPYNDLQAVRAALESHPGQVASLIVEPVAGNMGVIPPAEGYLAGLRRLCDEHGVVLIFDEVITGFRVGPGGAQQRYGVTPDLTCLGKIVGGGMPVGAYGGRRELMELVAPLGPAYQAGTLSGNPVAMAAGSATLRLLEDASAYEKLDRLTAALVDGLGERARKVGVPYTANRVGSMFTGFFWEGPVTDYASAKRSDTRRYAAYFHAMLDQGVYLAPSQFEAGFVSIAHTEREIEQTLEAAGAAFEAAARVKD